MTAEILSQGAKAALAKLRLSMTRCPASFERLPVSPTGVCLSRELK
jgi:hypothetical protein